MKKANNGRPSLAYLDQGFMESFAGRQVRVLSEFLAPVDKFRQNNINHTVVFFGTAREVPPAALRKGAPFRENRLYIKDKLREAAELSLKLTRWSNRLPNPEHRFAVCTGGGPGIMAAANRGAKRGRGKSIGLNIELPFEQRPNRWIDKELNFAFHYFFIRKYWFLYLAKAVVVFPGGFGTFDELFECLTLVQTFKIHKKLPVVLFGRKFWEELIDFKAFVKFGVVSPEDLKLFHFADTVEGAFQYLVRHLGKVASKKKWA